MWLLGLFSILLLIGIPVLATVAYFRTSKLIDQQSRFEKLLTARIQAVEDRLTELAESGVSAAAVIAEKTQDESVSEKPADGDTIPKPAQHNDPEEASPEDETDNEPEAKATVSHDDADERPAAARSSPWPVRQKPETKPFDVESLVGGRCSVLLGGLALALGVIFLVKYSIEEGLLGPGPRTVLGGLFSALLLGVREWLRRSDRDFDLPVYARADVPGILTGAGAIGAFATLYAAHALYGFIGPAFAFLTLSVVGLAAVLLSAIHGPKLAAVGILGAYATPMLVTSSEPNAIALTIHILIVTAVVMAVAHIRNWIWLAIAGIVASCAWIILAAIGGGVSSGLAGIILMTGIALIFACLSYLREPDDIADRHTDWVSVFAFGVLTFSFLGQLIINTELPATPAALLLTIIIAGLAGYRTSTAPIALCSAIVSLLAIAVASLHLEIIEGIVQTNDFSRGLVPPDITAYVTNAFTIALPPSLILMWGTRRTFFDAPVSSAWLASAVGVIAFFGLVLAYLRVAPFETRPAIGAVALGIAALFAVTTEYFIRLSPKNKQHPVPAAFAVSGIASACFAISVSLDTGWMPLAFGLTALGITTVYRSQGCSTLMYAALAGLLLFAYFSLMLRKAFQGQYLDLLRTTGDLEFWLYSPLWLLMGAVLLAIGLKLNNYRLMPVGFLMCLSRY